MSDVGVIVKTDVRQTAGLSSTVHAPTFRR